MHPASIAKAAVACSLFLSLLISGCGYKKEKLEVPTAITSAHKLERQTILGRFDKLCRQGSTLIVRKPSFTFSSESVAQGIREILPTTSGLLILSRGNDLRLQVWDPFLHSTYADLAATRDWFELYLKDRHKVYRGSFKTGMDRIVLDDADKGTRQNLAKMRPWHINEAFFLERLAADSELAITEDDSPNERFYEVHEIHSKDGMPRILQRVWIERVGLDIRRKILYDDNGAPLSDVQYNAWQGEDDKRYPIDMQLRRPQEKYQVRFQLREVEAGVPIAPKMLQLTMPSSVPVEDLDLSSKIPNR